VTSNCGYASAVDTASNVLYIYE